MTVFKRNVYVYLVFLGILITGLLVYPDYGFNMDEKFHRANGFYWLKYLAEFFQINYLYELSDLKLLSSSSFTQEPIDYLNKYGIVFDVPAALTEIVLKLEEPIQYHQMRHLMVFIYFFLGLIFFYKLLYNRFRNIYISLIGVILFFLTPRIFGDSFQNTKDIIFITFLIISVYYYFKSLDNFDYKNIILFALFSSVATSTRIMGILLPLSLILFYFLEILCNKKDIIKYKKIIFYFIFYFFFLYIHWPVLWENGFKEITALIGGGIGNFVGKTGPFGFGPEFVYFNGDFHSTDNIPYSYFFIWILITTPILQLGLFFIGLGINFNNLYINLIKIDKIKKKHTYDFWSNVSEKKDFYIFIIFIIIFLALTFLDVKQYNSWRMVYFLNFFIIYIAVFGINEIYKKIKNNLKIIKSLSLILLFFLIFNIYRLHLYHPYQAFYFSELLTKEYKQKFEVDYTGLSSIDFFRSIPNLEEKKIKVGAISWYPIWRYVELLNETKKNNIQVLFDVKRKEADYLYTNRIYNDNIKINDKRYRIPENFIKFKELIVDDIIIYEMYKKIK